MRAMTKTTTMAVALSLGVALPAAPVYGQARAERAARSGAQAQSVAAQRQAFLTAARAFDAQVAERGLETSATAPAPWLQEDPGAKAYQAAREALNARRYADAARAFAELRSKFPQSGYVADS